MRTCKLCLWTLHIWRVTLFIVRKIYILFLIVLYFIYSSDRILFLIIPYSIWFIVLIISYFWLYSILFRILFRHVSLYIMKCWEIILWILHYPISKIISFFCYNFLIIGGKLWELVNCAYEHYTFEGLLYL